MRLRNRHILLPALTVLALLLGACAATDTPDTPAEEREECILFSLAPASGLTFESEEGVQDPTRSDAEASAATRLGASTSTRCLVEPWKPARTATRAQGDDVPEQAIEAVMPETIGVFGYNNRAGSGLSQIGAGEVFCNIPFYYGLGETYKNLEPTTQNPYNWDLNYNLWPYEKPKTWISSFSDDDPTRYKFFVYAPYDADFVEIQENSYSNIKRFVWDNIRRYTPRNVMICDRLMTYKSKAPGEKNGVQEVTMRQMQSRVRFLFNLGPTFSSLRTIRLRSMKVTDLQGISLKLTVNFDESGTDALGNTIYTSRHTWSSGSDLSSSEIELTNEPSVQEAGYVELSQETRYEADGVTLRYQPLASLYVYPYNNLRAVNIVVTYDVYDRAGQLLREGETAKNTIYLNLSSAENSEDAAHPHVLKPGYYYDAKIRIEPNYLYVLSDNDFLGEDEMGGHLVIQE